MKKRSALVLVVLAMLCMAWPAGAEWKQWNMSSLSNVVSPGASIMPRYNDFSSRFGSSYTQDKFNITYSTQEEHITVDADGRVHVGEEATFGKKIIDITYTRIGNPKLTDTFEGSVNVQRPLKKMTLSHEVLYLPVTGDEVCVTATVYGVTNSSALRYVEYDNAILSIARASTPSYSTDEIYVYFEPVAVGETHVNFVSHNGIIKVLPVHVVDKVQKLEFAIDHVYCEPGDVIDLGIDLGNGEYGREAYASQISRSTRRDGAYGSANSWFSENQFVAEIGGEYTLSMAMKGFDTAYAYITVYDDAACTDIQLSADLTKEGVSTAEILVYDADGRQIQRPMKIIQEDQIVTLNGGEVTVSKTGAFTVNVTNPDGSIVSKTFEAKREPNYIYLNDSHIDLKVGDTYELEVTYDVEGDFPYEMTYTCWNYDFDGPEPIRMEGNRIIVQATGQASVSVRYGRLSAICYIYVDESDENIWLEFSKERTAVGVPIRAAVVNKNSMIITSTYSCDPEKAAITADGYVTPLVPGSINITATTEDGLTMDKTLTVTALATKITVPDVLIKAGGYVSLPTITREPRGVEDWALTISVEDTTIATYDETNKRFRAVSPGVTTGVVRCNYNDVEARFIIEVVSNELYIGSTAISVPYGFYTYLPAVTDAKGNLVEVTWAITQENLAANNPNSSAFMLEEDRISCIWPEGSCIVTGTTKAGETVKVKVSAYRISQAISISPDVVEVPLGQSVEVKVVNEDPGSSIPAVYWLAETEQIVTFKDETSALTNSLYGYKVGSTLLMALLDNGAYALCEVQVVDQVPRIPGDTNDDGVVDAKDALRIMQYDAGWNVSINGWQGDVNADGKTDLEDAMLIFQYAAGFDVQLREYIPVN